MNPYQLARAATGKNTIVEATMDPQIDYYESFFIKRNWPYNLAIPINSPWHNPRPAAQQGHFTVHGLDRRPLNEQVDDSVVRCVDIPAEAAVYGVRHLTSMFGFDRFTIFRDFDSLGKDICDRVNL
jgi:hypothetical protein